MISYSHDSPPGVLDPTHTFQMGLLRSMKVIVSACVCVRERVLLGNEFIIRCTCSFVQSFGFPNNTFFSC